MVPHSRYLLQLLVTELEGERREGGEEGGREGGREEGGGRESATISIFNCYDLILLVTLTVIVSRPSGEVELLISPFIWFTLYVAEHVYTPPLVRVNDTRYILEYGPLPVAGGVAM